MTSTQARGLALTAVGVVPLVGRDGLVFSRIGLAPTRVPLFVRAVEAVRDAGLPVVVFAGPEQALGVDVALASARLDATVATSLSASTIEDLTGADRVLVHDPCCPLVPGSFLRDVLEDSAECAENAAYVAVRPVVDTMKATVDGVVAGTVERDRLRIVSSPVVLPGATLKALGPLDGTLVDMSALVAHLRKYVQVRFIPAPASSRRVEDVSALSLITAADAVGHRLRER